MDPERFVVDVPDNPQRVVLGRRMLVVDGEEHARYRGTFARALQALAVRRRLPEAFWRTGSKLLLDAIAASGGAELGAELRQPVRGQRRQRRRSGWGWSRSRRCTTSTRRSPRAWSGTGIPMLWREPLVAAPGWTSCWRRASRVSVLHLTTRCSPLRSGAEAAAWRTPGGAAGQPPPDPVRRDRDRRVDDPQHHVGAAVTPRSGSVADRRSRPVAGRGPGGSALGPARRVHRPLGERGHGARWRADRPRRLLDRGDPCRQPRPGRLPGPGPVRHQRGTSGARTSRSARASTCAWA